jgi:hypothetical protein
VTTTGKNRIMIFGAPETTAPTWIEFRSAEGEALAISIPRSETAVIRHFQERMPYGLFVPEVPSEQPPDALRVLFRRLRTCRPHWLGQPW